MEAEKPYKIVLSLGRLHPLKGLDLLIPAWAEVKKCGNARMRECANAGMRECANESSWQLVIAGPDEQGTQEQLKALSEKLKLKVAEPRDLSGVCDADILFMGSVYGDEKWSLMQRADIFVLPSRSENFGMVVGEALSCGVPVVTTAVGPWGEGSGEMRECVNARMWEWERDTSPGRGRPWAAKEMRECVNAQMREWERGEVGASDSSPVLMEKRGLIVVETSVEGIVEGLQRMMALSDSERKEIGHKGCEWVRREFSWGSVARKMVEAYNTARMRECANAGM